FQACSHPLKAEIVIGSDSPQLAILRAAELERCESFNGPHPDRLCDFGIQLAELFEDELYGDACFGRVAFSREEFRAALQRDFSSLKSGARMIDEHLPHRSRGDAEEMVFIDDARFEALQF